ncbi:MAG: GNAT family N-acetyltransferase [Firmicutes bacterium]|nr:GNAT family N-acetyltransferase [Bacillota bacterium]
MPSVCVEELVELEPDLLQALINIEQDAFGRGGMNEWFLPPFARQGRVFVLWVEETDQPVGVAECMRIWDRPHSAYLFGFAIRSDWRGRGLGTIFMQEIIRRLQLAGFLSIELTVSPTNTAALRIYQDKLGFAKIAECPGEYGPGEDRLVLRLDLV